MKAHETTVLRVQDYEDFWSSVEQFRDDLLNDVANAVDLDTLMARIGIGEGDPVAMEKARQHLDRLGDGWTDHDGYQAALSLAWLCSAEAVNV